LTTLKNELTRELLSVQQVAEVTGISKRTVWYLRKSRRLPKEVSIGRLVRWRKSDIHLWIEWDCPDEKQFEFMKVQLSEDRRFPPLRLCDRSS
jgi:excisionase family DNA binding protein